MEKKNEVKTRCPQIYSFVKSRVENPPWEEISKQLELLNWMELSSSKITGIFINALEIADHVATADPQEQTFNVLDLPRVKYQLNNVVFAISGNKSMVKELSAIIKKKIQTFSFFRGAKNQLLETPDPELVKTYLEIEGKYKDLKDILTQVFSHIELSFKSDSSKTFSQHLDSEFYNNILLHTKYKLKSFSELKKSVEAFEKSVSPGYGTSVWGRGYTPYNQFRESDYFGTLDKNGNREGYGKITFYNGDRYEGFWENDSMHGKGIYYWKTGGRYEGEFQYGQIQGFGKRVYSSGNSYEGNFVNNRKEGRGLMKFKNGDEYEGEWKDDDMHGAGEYRWVSGDVYRGRFKLDRRHGRGTLTLANGEVYEAEWHEDKMISRIK